MREAGARTPDEHAPAPADARATRPRGTSATRILVVDDEPAIRSFIADGLRASGYDVVVAASGRDALAAVYADTLSPALLLTDIEMPGMNGIELAARLRADRPATRVVLMTGREASAARAREREGLVEGVLLKPFGLGELLAAVLEAMGEPPAA